MHTQDRTHTHISPTHIYPPPIQVLHRHRFILPTARQRSVQAPVSSTKTKWLNSALANGYLLEEIRQLELGIKLSINPWSVTGCIDAKWLLHHFSLDTTSALPSDDLQDVPPILPYSPLIFISAINERVSRLWAITPAVRYSPVYCACVRVCVCARARIRRQGIQIPLGPRCSVHIEDIRIPNPVRPFLVEI